MQKRALRILGALIGLALLLAIGIVAWAFATEHKPAPLEAVTVACTGKPTPLVAGQPFKILSWNLQYGAPRTYHFFYDDGDRVFVEEADLKAAVEGMAAVIREVDAPINLLQEVDRGSSRTHELDELPIFAEAAGATCSASATYHRSPFVPTPPSRPLGKVDMNVALLSRAPMQAAERTQLALLNEPRYRQVFNLKRALLTAEVPVEGWSQPLALAVTHLSAFSKGDGTLEKQVKALESWMATRPPDQPWILAGDFNILPPGDDASRLEKEGDAYSDARNPLEDAFAKYKEVFADQQLAAANRTYYPFGIKDPDRKIDYIFYGGPVTVVSAQVLRPRDDLSDHLPLTATLIVGPPPVVEAPPAEAGAPAAAAPPAGAAATSP